jgi:uncharacterized protein (DUF488 family)
MEVYTIGFTKRPAADFFGALNRAGVKRLIDIRVSNSSQLAGFTKRDDLAFFLKEIAGAEYKHDLALAPTQDLLRAYRKKAMTWQGYEQEFLALMRERRIEQQLSRGDFMVPTVLLCSELSPNRCHRRLVAEYLQKTWGNLEIVHL